MSCARKKSIWLPLLAVAALSAAAFGQQWSADGPCGLPAVIQGIDVGDVCDKLGISHSPIYGPDRSPWIQVANAYDCGRLRAELERLLSGSAADGAPPIEAEAPTAETLPLPVERPKTDLELWLERNNYESFEQAEAERVATEKKWREERATSEKRQHAEYAKESGFFRDELRADLAMLNLSRTFDRLKTPKSVAAEPRPEPPAEAVPAEEWGKALAKWQADLEQVNRDIEGTRQALLKLVRAGQQDATLFGELEGEAQQGLARSKQAIIDLALDVGMGLFLEGAKGWASYAPGGQAKPEAIREYQQLFGLIDRLKEAKATRDFAALAANEGKTEAELYEMARDGIGQLSGLLGVDETLPGRVWKYGTLLFDQAYNYTALYQVWGSVSALERNNPARAEGIRKLSERLHRLMEEQQEMRKKIEAGEKIEFKD